jgi:cytosine/adenosine deaminase-related metal-dependent hydrolase
LRERAAAAWRKARSSLGVRGIAGGGAGEVPVANVRPGLSPHAPYSVSSNLFRRVASHARKERLPVAIHLAETIDELELLSHFGGRFRPFLAELGIWEFGELVSEPDEVLRIFAKVSPVLLVHGNYLDSGAPIPPGGTIVYCPRTHAAFGHAPHPFRLFLARGVRVALGTDSLASNPDLDVLAEARFLRRQHPDVAGDVLLRMATLAGAEALGWQDETGSLTAGKSADLVAVPLPPITATDPHDLMLASDEPVAAVLLRGRWLREGRSQGPGGPPDAGPARNPQ